MAQFKFDKEKHIYTLDDKRLTGVTTILGVISKPALIPWAVKMCADYLRENYKGELTEELLKEAKSAHRKKKEKAGDVGTIVHDTIENYVKDGTIPELDEQATKMFNSFREWYDGNYELVESEKRLYSEKHWYAGTVDLVLKDKSGRHYIADIKTSSGVYPEYYAQMGGYHIAYDEMGNKEPIKGYIIVHIPKTGKPEQYLFEDTEMCKEFFLHANGLYKIMNNYKF